MHDNQDRSMLTGIATVFAMALADAVVKSTSGDMTLWQIYVLRSLLVTPVLLVLARRSIPVDGIGRRTKAETGSVDLHVDPN